MVTRVWSVRLLCLAINIACISAFSKERVLSLLNTPTREALHADLKAVEFDVLIIGGGATGAGLALESANRELKVALLEKGDFSSETSSKSTKLIHGGVRYLEKAVLNFDKRQYDLVQEALQERTTLFQMAPYLVRPIKCITPLYHLWEIPYYWMGLKVYDWIAGKGSVHKSEFISSEEIQKKIPFIKAKGLVGGVSYYDGQFNDTRLNITLILSAQSLGAICLNYIEVEGLLKDPQTKVIQGVIAKDKISGDMLKVLCKKVINATGPYVDQIRKLDDPRVFPIIAPSSGTHLVLKKEVMPFNTGLLIPKTKDGRVLFLLPWEGKTLVGTTDEKADLTMGPIPTKQDIDYLLRRLDKIKFNFIS